VDCVEGPPFAGSAVDFPAHCWITRSIPSKNSRGSRISNSQQEDVLSGSMKRTINVREQRTRQSTQYLKLNNPQQSEESSYGVHACIKQYYAPKMRVRPKVEGSVRKTVVSRKHLVLDHDVHLRLLRRKKILGISIRGIGNSILRVCLDKSIPMIEFLRDELVAMGKITPNEYDAAIQRAMKRAAEISRTDDSFLPAGNEGAVVSGSWTIKRLHHLKPGNVRIYDFSVDNMRGLMTPSHYHSQDLHALVLSGVVAFHVGTDQHHLAATSGIHIPAGQSHSGVPLAADTRMLVALVDQGTEDGVATTMLDQVRLS